MFPNVGTKYNFTTKTPNLLLLLFATKNPTKNDKLILFLLENKTAKIKIELNRSGKKIQVLSDRL